MENNDATVTDTTQAETAQVNTELFVTPDEAAQQPTIVKTVIVCPHCKGEIVIERAASQRRGQLAGLSPEEMDDEQLKRELINSKSVLYKAEKRGAGAEIIQKNTARVAAATAEKLKRTPAVVATAAEPTVTVYKAEDSAAAEPGSLASEI